MLAKPTSSARRSPRVPRLLFFAIALTFLSAVRPAYAQFPWQLVWSDEFNGAAGSQPNSSNWTYDTGGGGWGNDELEIYCGWGDNTSPCSTASPNAYLDGNGDLIIEPQEPSSGTYTSARMLTAGLQNFQYGRIEARIEIPGAQGMWPAFWMLGSDGVTWPGDGEIDIQEAIGADLNSGSSNLYDNHGSLHGPVSPGSGSDYSQTAVYGLANPMYEGFHTYAIEWYPGEIDFFVDGTLYERQSPSLLASGNVWEFDQSDNPFFILLNTAVGGDWPGSPDSSTPFPEYMTVDYVRVYQLDRGALPADWGNYDDGGPGVAGSSSYSNGTYTVTGGGSDIWGTYDQFEYTYTPLQGNGQIVAQVTSQEDTNEWAKAGIMIRNTRDAAAPYVFMAVTPSNGVQFQSRTSQGASATNVAGPGGPMWLMIQRSGDTFTGSYSSDGNSWTQLSSVTISNFNQVALAGLAVSAHDNSTTSTATFANVSYTNSDASWDGTPQWLPGWVQFEDYDTGGQGWAYNTSSGSNQGGQWRPQENISIEQTSDYGDSGYDVGWTAAGEWINYTVSVQQAGTYTLNVRCASNGQGGTFHFNVDESPVTGEITVPNTGGWQDWTTVSTSGVSLPAGIHTVAIVMDSNGPGGSVGNFDWFSFN
jgi:beta-glucanase (GH16 family)